MGAFTLDEVRAECLAYPEVTERLTHEHPGFFVREKKLFASYHAQGQYWARPNLWVPALPGVQEAMVAAEPERYFRPPYVGPSGWVGVYLDGEFDRDVIAGVVEDAYRMRAPKACLVAAGLA